MRKLRTAVFNKLVGSRTNKFPFMAASVAASFFLGSLSCLLRDAYTQMKRARLRADNYWQRFHTGAPGDRQGVESASLLR